LQYRTIDGKVMYFRREPSNLFRFSQDARQRAHQPAADADKAPDWKLIDHLKNVVAQAESTGKTEVSPLHHRIEYCITIPESTAAPGRLEWRMPGRTAAAHCLYSADQSAVGADRRWRIQSARQGAKDFSLDRQEHTLSRRRRILPDPQLRDRMPVAPQRRLRN